MTTKLERKTPITLEGVVGAGAETSWVGEYSSIPDDSRKLHLSQLPTRLDSWSVGLELARRFAAGEYDPTPEDVAGLAADAFQIAASRVDAAWEDDTGLLCDLWAASRDIAADIGWALLCGGLESALASSGLKISGGSQ